MGKIFTSIFILFFAISIGISQNSTTFKDKSVYIFLLHDCVICQSYAPYLEELYQNHQSSFNFIGVFPNFISKEKDIQTFKENFGISFSTKTDYFKSLTKQFNVTVTPEVIIYDEVKKEVLYQGRIDDEFFAIGKRKQVVSSHELKDALDGIVSGIPFNKKTTPIGCFINFEDLIKK
ncbi:MAG TPA: hypothetical protein PLZ32_04270 [Saprospiraceae bacterium]|nr:hypothetical protein [Saprospiraceae bacterium]